MFGFLALTAAVVGLKFLVARARVTVTKLILDQARIMESPCFS